MKDLHEKITIGDGTKWLKVAVVDQVPLHLPTPGDTKLSTQVEVGDFTGRGYAWIEAHHLLAFVAALRKLEADRQGAAEIVSMSPGEFRLRVLATDNLGHLAVEGQISASGQSLEFGFSLCPSLLPGVVSQFATLVRVAGSPLLPADRKMT